MTIFATREVSSPELACKDLLSSVFEFFKRGTNLGLIGFILEVARVQMVSRLKTRDVMPELCKLLNCDNNALPIELGFADQRSYLALSMRPGISHVQQHVCRDGPVL